MGDHVTVGIADVSIGLTAEAETGGFLIHRRFRPFVVERCEDVSVGVHYKRWDSLELGEKVFETDQEWRVYSKRDKVAFQVDACLTTPDMVGVFSLDFTKGDVYFPSGGLRGNLLPFPLGWPMGRLLMVSVLGQGHGAILHASGVRMGDHGFLFAGTDGIGKTTIAKLWAHYAGATIIGDDHIAVRKRRDQIWMYSVMASERFRG